MSFGRMSADGEIVALRASGISATKMLPPALALGVIATVASAYLIFEVQPRASMRIRSLTRELAGSVQVIEPGRFLEFGDRLLYVHSVSDPNCPLEGVLLGSAEESSRSFYAAAHCGTVENSADAHTLSFVLHDGSIHFRDPDPARYRRIRFAALSTAVDISDYTDPRPGVSQLTMEELFTASRLAKSDPEYVRLNGRFGRSIACQIQRRLSFPFASILLGLVAVPLGIRPMRSGRSAGALTAIAVMALYWLLFSLGDMAAYRGVLPPWLGYWIPNAVALMIGVTLVRRVGQSDD
ncbi:MAG TPA: LptF/LptG family permease, partial [Myxococcota bacterium]|nr:LptF/LptG family permease [Myxococcota bacterium]